MSVRQFMPGLHMHCFTRDTLAPVPSPHVGRGREHDTFVDTRVDAASQVSLFCTTQEELNEAICRLGQGGVGRSESGRMRYTPFLANMSAFQVLARLVATNAMYPLEPLVLSTYASMRCTECVSDGTVICVGVDCAWNCKCRGRFANLIALELGEGGKGGKIMFSTTVAKTPHRGAMSDPLAPPPWLRDAHLARAQALGLPATTNGAVLSAAVHHGMESKEYHAAVQSASAGATVGAVAVAPLAIPPAPVAVEAPAPAGVPVQPTVSRSVFSKDATTSSKALEASLVYDAFEMFSLLGYSNHMKYVGWHAGTSALFMYLLTRSLSRVVPLDSFAQSRGWGDGWGWCSQSILQ